MAAATGVAPEGIMSEPELNVTVEPDADQTAAYEDAYGAFRQSYPAIRSIQ
jgi:xylulokinase